MLPACLIPQAMQSSLQAMHFKAHTGLNYCLVFLIVFSPQHDDHTVTDKGDLQESRGCVLRRGQHGYQRGGDRWACQILRCWGCCHWNVSTVACSFWLRTKHRNIQQYSLLHCLAGKVIFCFLSSGFALNIMPLLCYCYILGLARPWGVQWHSKQPWPSVSPSSDAQENKWTN